jgi:hypothetical protein
MSDHPQHDGRRRVSPVAAAVAAVVAAVAGAAILATGLGGADAAPPVGPDRTVVAAPGTPAPAPSPTSSPAPAAPSTGMTAPATPAEPVAELGPVLPASDPVALSIPSIGVASDVLEPLALDADGVLPAPADYALPGWYTGGPKPGQFGPAVLAGHVDGPSGPAVFYRLGELAVGATVDVTLADGTVATFVVDAVERYAKADFPTSRVYGNTTDRAELRLITCGGAFDRTTGHYVDNIVAYAHLV